MDKPTELSVIIPAYNEEAVIADFLKQLKETLKKIKYHFEIIVINDGSKDRTKAILEDIKGIKVLTNKQNTGYGYSLKKGIKDAKGDYILIIDSDGTYPVNEIPNLIKFVNEYDMVVGARIGNKVAIPFFRKPAKWFLRKLAGYIADKKIPDLNSGLRIFRKDIVIRFWDLFPDGFSFTSTITLACLTNDYEVKFVPINYHKRKGKSSIKPLKDFMGFTQLVIRIVTYFKPLNVFLPISLLFISVGMIKLVIDILRTTKFGLGAVMIILAGIQIGFLGLLADLIIKRTRL